MSSRHWIGAAVVALLLTCSAAIPALAGTTYHVTSPDRDDNGTAEGNNGTCPDHGSIGGSWTSCANSITAGCTSAQPCCTIQNALDKALGPGDVVEIHSGRYDPAYETGTTASILLYTFQQTRWLTVKPCTTCSTPPGSIADLRTIRGASGTDRPKLFSTSGANVGWPILIGNKEEYPGTIRWLTLQRLELTGFHQLGAPADTKPVGIIQNGDTALEITIDDLYMHDINQGQEHCEQGNGLHKGRFIGLIGFANGIEGATHVEIKNSRLYTDNCGINFAMSGAPSGTNSCTPSAGGGIFGLDIHNNELINNNTSDQALDNTHEIGYFEDVTGFAFHDNIVNCQTTNLAGCGVFFRQLEGPNYVFNNYFYRFGREYSQDICGTLYLFNNTVVWDQATDDDAMGFRFTEFGCGDLGGCVYRARNNSFYGMKQATDGVSSTTFNAGYEHLGLTGVNYNGGSQGNTQDTEAAHYVCANATSCGASTAVASCLGTPCRDSPSSQATFYAATGNRPFPYYKVKPGSILVDAGTNDPIGSGANACSITLWTNHVIDCTKDYDGDDRTTAGSTWDIGADEYVTGEATPANSRGIWIAQSTLTALPMTGQGWTSVLAAANTAAGAPDITDIDSAVDVLYLAKALVYARDTTTYAAKRTDVVSAINALVADGMAPWEAGGSAETLAICRGLQSYVIAADLVGLSASDETAFKAWLVAGRVHDVVESTGTNIVQSSEERPNNQGSHCRAARLAIARYLGAEEVETGVTGTQDVARIVTIFKGWLGDRAQYNEDSTPGFDYGDLSWQATQADPVGINPVGAVISAHDVDGVQPDDQRRQTGIYSWPPLTTNYTWGNLACSLTVATMLDRAGHTDVWTWSNSALLRAVDWLYRTTFGDGAAADDYHYPAAGNDEWQPWLINHFYGTSYTCDSTNPTCADARAGKAIGWTEWTHATVGTPAVLILRGATVRGGSVR